MWSPKRQKKRINWDSPTLKQNLHRLLEEGHSQRHIAAAWGVQPDTLSIQLQKRALNALPADRVTIAEAASTLNLGESGVHALMHRLNLPMGYWGKQRTLTTEQLRALSTREQIVRERPHGYVTVAELSMAWNMAETCIKRRLLGLHRLAWVGDAPRVKHLYLLRDASTRAPRPAPATCPQGRWTSAELAAALDLPTPTVTGWANHLDCPALKGRKNYYYRPHEVAAWLLARRKAPMRAYGEQLQAILTERAAA